MSRLLQTLRASLRMNGIDPSTAARQLAQHKVIGERAKVRARTAEIAADNAAGRIAPMQERVR